MVLIATILILDWGSGFDFADFDLCYENVYSTFPLQVHRTDITPWWIQDIWQQLVDAVQHEGDVAFMTSLALFCKFIFLVLVPIFS